MESILLFDGDAHRSLLPLTFARPVAELRCGILTIAEKYSRFFPGAAVEVYTQGYLREIYPLPSLGGSVLAVRADVLPNREFVHALSGLAEGQIVRAEGETIAARLPEKRALAWAEGNYQPDAADGSTLSAAPARLRRCADVFLLNDRAIRDDFKLLTQSRRSQPVSDTNTVIGPAGQLFVEEGVTLEACTLNCAAGPIYLGREATLLEGCLIRGPLAVGESSVLKMGAKIYGATTLGPRCKVGGEVNNVVFQANSNKGHEGYLGNSVIGEWCNLGADTNASNLKNDYGNIKVWSYKSEASEPTGLQFHGLIMGDHSKTGINTMLNTGTVVGFSVNLFGANFPKKFVPSFSWGGASATMQEYRLDKAIQTAGRVMARRGRDFRPVEKRLFTHIHATTARYRGGEGSSSG